MNNNEKLTNGKKVIMSPVFQTEYMEALFERCARENMYSTSRLGDNYYNGDASLDEKAKVIMSSVFKTKEQEELFSKIAQDVMYNSKVFPEESPKVKKL